MQTQPGSRAPFFRSLLALFALPLTAWSALAAIGPDRHAPARPAAPVVVTSAPFGDRRPDVGNGSVLQRILAEREKRARVNEFKVKAVLAYDALIARAQVDALHAQRVATWDTLANCESAGHWNVVDRFGGGLGIYIGTWQGFGGNEFASNPGYATKEQQIIVAERIYARFGFTGWGCAHTLGWVH